MNTPPRTRASRPGRTSLFLVLVGSLLLLPTLAAGQGFGIDEEVLSARAVVSRDVVPAGSNAELAVLVELHGNWHINAAKPADEMLIPTTFKLAEAPGLSVGEPSYPEPHSREFDFSDQPLLVYEGKFQIRIPFGVEPGFDLGATPLVGKLRYQACDDERCLAPRTETITVEITVAAEGSDSKAAHVEVFGDDDGSSAAGSPDEASRIIDLFKRGGASRALAFGLIFLVGLGLNLTPCVYPIIPITLGFFTSQSEKRGGKTFGLAIAYVLGMVIMYATLGVAAALSGKVFGAALGSPWVLGFEAFVMVALALSMFGLWDIGIPTFLATRLSASPSGLGGALFMGLTVGIVAAPCLAPVVAGLFVSVGEMADVTLGAAIFSSLAFGLGLPYLFLGMASGSISQLPRSGEWMIWIKHFFGFLLLGMSLYFLRPLIGDTPFVIGLCTIALIGGAFLGFIDKTGANVAAFRRLKAVVGVAMLLAGIGGFVGLASSDPSGSHVGIVWTDYEPAEFESTRGAGKPMLVDFTAEWCIPCKELERFTFGDEKVAAAALRFAPFRVDGTTQGDPEVDALQTRFEVRGYPTILFLDDKGEEIVDLRVVGFVDAEEFLKRLEAVP